jgi:hypothetical protein
MVPSLKRRYVTAAMSHQMLQLSGFKGDLFGQWHLGLAGSLKCLNGGLSGGGCLGIGGPDGKTDQGT